METIVYIIVGIGVLVIGIPLLGVSIFLWFITVPLLGALMGGWIGFFFGVGLDVIIYILFLGSKAGLDELRKRPVGDSPSGWWIVGLPLALALLGVIFGIFDY